MELQEELTSNFEDTVKTKWQQRVQAAEQRVLVAEQKASMLQDQSKTSFPSNCARTQKRTREPEIAERGQRGQASDQRAK